MFMLLTISSLIIMIQLGICDIIGYFSHCLKDGDIILGSVEKLNFIYI